MCGAAGNGRCGDGSWLKRLHGELRGLLAPVFAQARSRLAAFAYIGALQAEPGTASRAGSPENMLYINSYYCMHGPAAAYSRAP